MSTKRQWRIPQVYCDDKFNLIQNIEVVHPQNTLTYSRVETNAKEYPQEYIEYMIAKLKLIKAEFPAVIDANIKFLEDVISYNNEPAKTCKNCGHNVMVPNNDPQYAWKCADCGYVYGSITEEQFREYLKSLDDMKRIRFTYKIKSNGQTRTIVDTERGFQGYNHNQGDNFTILKREDAP